MKYQVQKAAYQAADAEQDIGLMNRYSRKELTPEEVYVFSVILCDNEVDRDYERFTEKSLKVLAKLFEGRSGVFDHQWSATSQAARLYRTEVEPAQGETGAGTPRQVLRGWAYMIRTPENESLIAEIEGGIKKEVSVGCAMGRAVCSVCGNDAHDRAKCSHIKGKTYDGKLCYADLEDPQDAYEWSFVAVPAQRGAGVTKASCAAKADEAARLLLDGGLALCPDRLGELHAAVLAQLESETQREKKRAILSENAAILTVFQRKDEGK